MKQSFILMLILSILILFFNFAYSQVKSGVIIQKLIDDAKDGSTVIIPDGTYNINEPISIEERENLKIIFGKETKIISDSKENSIMELYNCSNIIIKNGIFLYNSPDIKSEYAFHFEECEGVLLDKCEVTAPKSIAFDCYSSDKIGITNCYIHDSHAMLNLDLVSNAKITNNKIENTPVFPKGAELDREYKQLLKTIMAKNKFITSKK